MKDDLWISSSSGDIRRRFAIEGFAITEVVHRAGQVIQRHIHDYATMGLVVDGSVEEHVAGRTHVCQSGQFLIRPPSESHSNQYGPCGARSLIVAVTGIGRQRIGEVSRIFDRVKWSDHGLVASLAAQLYVELLEVDDTTPLAIEGLLLELIALATRELDSRAECAGVPSWLRMVREMLHDRFREEIRLNDLAACARVHPMHVGRAFRRWYGCSPGAYVRRLRIESSCRALVTTRASLAQIALDHGFASQGHFSTVFKRLTRTTPLAYRRNFGHERERS